MAVAAPITSQRHATGTAERTPLMQSGITRRAFAGAAFGALFLPGLAATPGAAPRALPDSPARSTPPTPGSGPARRRIRAQALAKALAEAGPSGQAALPAARPLRGRRGRAAAERPILSAFPARAGSSSPAAPFMLRGEHMPEAAARGGHARRRRPPPRRAAALLDADDVADVAIDDCDIHSERRRRREAPRVLRAGSRTRASTEIGSVGIYLRQSDGMTVSGNIVSDCGDTGILVSRDEESEDGSIVRGNRVSRDPRRFRRHRPERQRHQPRQGERRHRRRQPRRPMRLLGDPLLFLRQHRRHRQYRDEFRRDGPLRRVRVRGRDRRRQPDRRRERRHLLHQLRRARRPARHLLRQHRQATSAAGRPIPDGNLQNGAGISAEADVAITGNTVEDALWGLQLGWGPYLRDVDRDAATSSAARRSASPSRSRKAQARRSSPTTSSPTPKQGAILGMRWDEVATKELIGGETALPGVTIAGNHKG